MKTEGGGMATGNNFGEKLLPPLCVCVCAFPSVSIVTGKLYAKIESFCRAQLKLRFSIVKPRKSLPAHAAQD